MKISRIIKSISIPTAIPLISIFLTFAVACSSTSDVKRIETVSDPNSMLLKVVVCDETVADADSWSWMSISLSQMKHEDSEFILCVMNGYYQMGSNQYWGSLRVSVDKYEKGFTLDQDIVKINFLSEGKSINLPSIIFSTKKPMFSTCLQDNEEFSCLIAIQYDSTTVLYVRVDGSNQIPISIVEHFFDSVLPLEDELITRNLLQP